MIFRTIFFHRFGNLRNSCVTVYEIMFDQVLVYLNRWSFWSWIYCDIFVQIHIYAFEFVGCDNDNSHTQKFYIQQKTRERKLKSPKTFQVMLFD